MANMRLYHGSPIRGLTVLTSATSCDDNFEGAAIYLTDSFAVARDYSQKPSVGFGSVYEVDVDAAILDLTSKERINEFISMALLPIEIDWSALEWTDAATVHVLNHHGRNGVWSLALDVASIFKFEPKYKDNGNIEEIMNKVTSALTKALNKFSVFKITDNENRL
jgi:hypothetical protein